MLQKGHFALAASVFFAGIGVGGFNLGSTFFMQKNFGFMASDIGLYFGVFNIIYLASCLLSRKFVVGKDPARILLAVFTLQVASAAFFVSVPYVLAAYVAAVVMGIITAIQWPTCMGWISRGTNRKSLSKVTVLYNLSWSTGFLLSQKVVGVLALSHVNYPIYFAMLSFTVSLLIILLCMPILPPRFVASCEGQLRAKPTSNNPEAQNQKAEGPTQLPGDSPLDPQVLAYFRRISWVSLVVLSIFEATTRYIWPVIMQNIYALNENQIGVVMTFRYVGLILSFVILRFWEGWHLKRICLLTVWAVAALMLIPLIIGTNIVIFTLITILASMCMGFTYAFGFYHNSLQGDKSMIYMNVYETCITVGVLIGTLGGGYVSQFFGSSMLMGGIFVVTMAMLIFSSIFMKEPKAATHTGEAL